MEGCNMTPVLTPMQMHFVQLDTPPNRCDTKIFFIFPLDKFISDKNSVQK